jgi:hypothetical protein
MGYNRSIMGNGRTGIKILPSREVVMSEEEIRLENEARKNPPQSGEAPTQGNIPPSQPEPESHIIELGNIEPGGPESYIILPAGNYGNREYPDLLIGVNRISYTDARVQRTVNKLYPQQQFSDNDKGFMGEINHQQALDITKEIGGFTLSVLLEREFLRHLNKGVNDGNYKVYNGKGDKIRPEILKTVSNEIVEVRSPWRSEWNADRFLDVGGKMNVTTYVFDNGSLKEVTEELTDYLKQDKRIDYTDWLGRATKHGLPLSDCNDGEFYFWTPVNQRVARFVANSGGANLNCVRSPTSTGSSLGVREARKKT